jgi:catechol 2,3-dioxygenase-like lactoylglutathione lyase family enzyme
MKPHISVITLGVEDVNRAKEFYGTGLGWPIEQDYDQWVSFRLGDGVSGLGLYQRDALAADAGVPADGSGFRAFAFNYIVSSEGRVDEVLAEAERAGGKIVKPGESPQWGGYYGYFSDPDGNLWKVAAGAGGGAFAAE